jgi:hypothetical protein
LATELGAVVIRATLDRAKLPPNVRESECMSLSEGRLHRGHRRLWHHVCTGHCRRRQRSTCGWTSEAGRLRQMVGDLRSAANFEYKVTV